MKVFVSSTCYDLLDLRAEVEAHLRDLGLRPLLSDRPSSEFEVSPTVNSIETCLANVRTCDVFVCIVSQRYGPSLAKAGFEDISATHLEWRTARDAQRPIYMYVRDRTEGDAATWKKNKGATAIVHKWARRKKIALPWVQDTKLFGFLDEHRALKVASPTTNWIWTFRDSPELKARLSLDLKTFSSRAILLRWIEEDRLPTVRPESGNRTGYGFGRNTFEMSVAVHGDVPAIGVRACFDKVTWMPLPELAQGGKATRSVQYDLVDDGSGVSAHEIRLRYSTTFGATIEDTFQCKIPREGTDVVITLTRKQLVEGLGFEVA